jgi:hypothetical protein
MSSVSRSVQVFFFTAILLIVLVVGIQPVAAAADGNVQVYVEPSNVVATACVDQHCQVTSESSEGQAAEFNGIDSNSWHTVTVKATGYQDYSQTFYLTPGTQVIDAVLYPVPTPTPAPIGNLEITVSPKGGTACIDGTQCQNLPLDVNADGIFDFYSLAGNSYHTLTINQNGYQPYSASIYVNGGIDNGESVTLVPLTQVAPPSTTVQVTAAPMNAGTPIPVTSPANPVPQTTKAGLSPITTLGALGICCVAILIWKKE